jgi:sulfide:quinone oxidoreductase
LSIPAIRNFGGAPARVVIIGGGVGAVEAVLALRSLAKERVSIDLIAPTREFVYRPLSVLAPFGGSPAPHFNLSEIALDQGVRHHHDAAVAVDTARRFVKTGKGAEVGYDALVVAAGAETVEAVAGAITFADAGDHEQLRTALLEAERGVGRRIVFAVPPGVTWTLPLYELALNTAAFLATRVHAQMKVTLVTPEDAPLWLFGAHASDVVRGLLEERGVELRTGTHPVSFENGALNVVPEDRIEADHVVALPRLRGRPLPGLPADDDGFLPVDEHCLVHGLDHVYAVGDITDFAIKQGGITTEQADAAAEAIASSAGAPVNPQPFRPVLRGVLLTGAEPRYLSAHITRGPAIDSEAEAEALWWPPSKVPGRRLAHYLQERGKELAVPTERQEGIAVPFSVDGEAIRPQGSGTAATST